MQRIANGTQVASLPIPAAPIGTPGYGTSGDPGAGLLGSVFGADDFNRHQEELMAFLTAAGVTPDGGNNSQVLASARKLFGEMLIAGGTGAMRLPGGALLQWGNFLTSSAADVWVAFPLSFVSAPWTLVVSHNSYNAPTVGSVGTNGYTAAGFWGVSYAGGRTEADARFLALGI